MVTALRAVVTALRAAGGMGAGMRWLVTLGRGMYRKVMVSESHGLGKDRAKNFVIAFTSDPSNVNETPVIRFLDQWRPARRSCGPGCRPAAGGPLRGQPKVKNFHTDLPGVV